MPEEKFAESSLTSEDRQLVHSEQLALLQSLVLAGPVPPGFDEERLISASQSLARKRKRTILRACPQLLKLFGDTDELYAALERYCSTQPLQVNQVPYQDSLRFVLYLAENPISGCHLPENLIRQARQDLPMGTKTAGCSAENRGPLQSSLQALLSFAENLMSPLRR